MDEYEVTQEENDMRACRGETIRKSYYLDRLPSNFAPTSNPNNLDSSFDLQNKGIKTINLSK